MVCSTGGLIYLGWQREAVYEQPPCIYGCEMVQPLVLCHGKKTTSAFAVKSSTATIEAPGRNQRRERFLCDRIETSC